MVGSNCSTEVTDKNGITHRAPDYSYFNAAVNNLTPLNQYPKASKELKANYAALHEAAHDTVVNSQSNDNPIVNSQSYGAKRTGVKLSQDASAYADVETLKNNREACKEAQVILAGKGYGATKDKEGNVVPLTADGKCGKDTIKAIEQYKSDLKKGGLEYPIFGAGDAVVGVMKTKGLAEGADFNTEFAKAWTADAKNATFEVYAGSSSLISDRHTSVAPNGPATYTYIAGSKDVSAQHQADVEKQANKLLADQGITNATIVSATVNKQMDKVAEMNGTATNAITTTVTYYDNNTHKTNTVSTEVAAGVLNTDMGYSTSITPIIPPSVVHKIKHTPPEKTPTNPGTPTKPGTPPTTGTEGGGPGVCPPGAQCNGGKPMTMNTSRSPQELVASLDSSNGLAV